jgi:hypothetical protein
MPTELEKPARITDASALGASAGAVSTSASESLRRNADSSRSKSAHEAAWSCAPGGRNARPGLATFTDIAKSTWLRQICDRVTASSSS